MKLPVGLPPTPTEVGILGASVSPEADSSGQHPRNFCPLTLCQSFLGSFTDTVLSLLWSHSAAKSFPCYLSASTQEKSLSSGTLASCPPSCLTAVCGQISSLLHTSSERLDFRLSEQVSESTGERRQESSAGWCLPKCNLRMG